MLSQANQTLIGPPAFRRREPDTRSPVGSRIVNTLTKAGSGRRLCTRPERVSRLCATSRNLINAGVTSTEELIEVEVKVGGMMCDGCSSRVTEALQKLERVANVNVSLDRGLATLQVAAADQIEALDMVPHILEAVQDLGFEAEPHFSEE